MDDNPDFDATIAEARRLRAEAREIRAESRAVREQLKISKLYRSVVKGDVRRVRARVSRRRAAA
jgi:hypothetical protein